MENLNRVGIVKSSREQREDMAILIDEEGARWSGMNQEVCHSSSRENTLRSSPIVVSFEALRFREIGRESVSLLLILIKIMQSNLEKLN